MKLSLVGGDEILVLRNRTLRTVSDLDGSSTKESVLCAVRSPGSSLLAKVTFGGDSPIKGVRLLYRKLTSYRSFLNLSMEPAPLNFQIKM